MIIKNFIKILLLLLFLTTIQVYSYNITTGNQVKIDKILQKVDNKLTDYSSEDKKIYMENIVEKIDIMVNDKIQNLHISEEKKIYYTAVLTYINNHYKNNIISLIYGSALTEIERDRYKLGLNFIKFFYKKNKGDTEIPEYSLPENIFSDFEKLGVKIFRQFPKADLGWKEIEPYDNHRQWEESDEIINKVGYMQIVTLFKMQYASANAPWETSSDTWKVLLTSDAKDYLDKIIERYGDKIKYREIGNEMDHWRSFDPGSDTSLMDPTKYTGPTVPSRGFTVQQQGNFLKQVADYIREKDSNAVIVLPGMSNINEEYILSTWLPGIIEGAGGTDFFDIINYHYYGPWYQFVGKREDLQEFIDANDLGNKEVWLTETGVTSDRTLDIRTNYPNSEEEQAKELYRRTIPAYAHGDSLVLWHTHLSSVSSDTNDWRSYGLLTEDGEEKRSYRNYKRLASLIKNVEDISIISEGGKGGKNEYQLVMKDGTIVYIVYGKGDWTVPSRRSSYNINRVGTNVLLRPMDAGSKLSLNNNVYILTGR